MGIQHSLAQEEKAAGALADHEITAWSADLKCAEKRYPKALYSDAAKAFEEKFNISPESIHDQREDLLETSTTLQQSFQSVRENCPTKRPNPKLLSRSHEIYNKVLCMSSQGLSRRDWQSRVQELHERYKTSVPDYVSAKIELMGDPVYRMLSMHWLKENCPSRVQKRRLKAERTTPLPNGRYMGAASGVEGETVLVEIIVKDRTITEATAQAFGQKWTLRPRTAGSKMSLSGKAGPNTLFFKGKMRSGAFSGRFYARHNGLEHKGRWTAKR